MKTKTGIHPSSFRLHPCVYQGETTGEPRSGKQTRFLAPVVPPLRNARHVTNNQLTIVIDHALQQTIQIIALFCPTAGILADVDSHTLQFILVAYDAFLIATLPPFVAACMAQVIDAPRDSRLVATNDGTQRSRRRIGERSRSWFRQRWRMTPIKRRIRRAGYLGENEDAMHVVGHDNPFV